MKVINTVALAFGALSALSSAEILDLAWGLNLKTGEEILTISRAGEVLASACGNSLKIGEVRVKLESDTEANGQVTIGNAVHDLGEDMLCSASWNMDFVETSCHLPFDDDVDFSAASVVDGTHECFAAGTDGDSFPGINGDGVAEVYDLDLDAHAEDDTTSNPSDPVETGLVARQHCGGTTYSRTRANPANARKFRGWRQVTDGLDCGNGSCSISHGTVRSVTHTAGFTLSGFGKAEWASAGYSVSWSHSTTSTLGCNANKNQRVCIRNMRRYQRYRVHEKRTLCGTTTSRTYELRSPLSNDSLAGWYCSRGKNECDKSSGGTKWGDAGAGAW